MVGTSIPLILDETEDLISDTTSTTVTTTEKDEEKATVTGDETLVTIPSASLTTSTTEPFASSAISATTTAAPTDPTLPSQSTDKTSLGVWWWDIGLIKGSTGERYLDFLEDNDVRGFLLSVSHTSCKYPLHTQPGMRVYLHTCGRAAKPFLLPVCS